jgi:hypothetical protein
MKAKGAGGRTSPGNAGKKARDSGGRSTTTVSSKCVTMEELCNEAGAEQHVIFSSQLKGDELIQTRIKAQRQASIL